MQALTSRRQFVLILITALTVVGLGTTAAFAQQASITLTNCDGKPCYTHNNTWEITKEVTDNTIVDGVGTVTWTVTATKDETAAPTYSVHGGLTVTNTGSAPATIGNIVVNLQKPNSPKLGSNAPYVSIAANVATARSGDAATSANIVAGGSQENATTNAAWGTNNYTVSGAQGTFVETACSGKLEFKDASNNTVFSLTPQPTIAVGASITLLYDAGFATACLPAAGTTLRVEAIVTFGNAGLRGGSGATGSNIDIDGDGCLDNSSTTCNGVFSSPDYTAVEDNDEAKVRSVPCRVTLAPLPAAPEEANDSVSLVDTVSSTGTVTTSNVVNNVPATTDANGSWTVSADVDAGAEGGQVCNNVALDGAALGGTLSVIVGYDTTDPLNPIPIYATYECVAAADAEASACVDVTPNQGLQNGNYCTFSKGGFGGSGYPFTLLNTNFVALYPSGVEMGIPGTGGFSAKFTSATAVQNYLPAGGGASRLGADLNNPTSTSSGQFGGQVLALKLNIALSDAAVNPAGFGGLYYCPATSDSLAGLTVSQILGAAETALGCPDLVTGTAAQKKTACENSTNGYMPTGYTYSTLANLCANLDLSFDGTNTDFPNCGVASDWAVANLSKTPCP